MATTAQLHLERAELDAVLNSGIFSRAPNLACFLRYVCERYFGGEADQIKEYCIAVEALGRPSDFDQKKDSIVRVEAHRLRRRLTEYYAGDGSGHQVRIIIPNGGYAPQFTYIYKDTAFGEGDALPAQAQITSGQHLHILQEVTDGLVGTQTPLAETAGLESRDQGLVDSNSRRPGTVTIILLALGIAALAAVAFWVRAHSGRPFSEETWVGSYAAPVASEYRFIAGYHGLPFQDRQGRKWQQDAYYVGGQSREVVAGRHMEALPDPAFPKSYREGTFRYNIPVRTGVYELHLYFAETQFGPSLRESETGRLFRLTLNGRVVLDLFDVAAEAGSQNRLFERVYKDVAPGKDGQIHLTFEGISDQAVLYAAEILASSPGRLRPVRVVASETSVIDSEGKAWSADQYFIGGRLAKRAEGSVESPSQKLYEGERYGNFSYRIPLTPGKYRVQLFFAETWFGSKLQFAPSQVIGARVFNVFANGVALLRDFDIAKEALGPGKGVEKTFEGIEPNAQGMIVLEFVPVRNYAEINAIEVVPMQ